MGYIVYVNKVKNKARLHNEDCYFLHQNGGGKLNNDGEHYFEEYDDAWEYMFTYLEDYDYGDCKHCNPLN
jgi:hypothetical protein